MVLPVVILKGCDFLDFSQKPSLKTFSLDANIRFLNKVTASERSVPTFFVSEIVPLRFPCRDLQSKRVFCRAAFAEIPLSLCLNVQGIESGRSRRPRACEQKDKKR